MSMLHRPLGELCTEIYRYPTYYGIEYVEDGVPKIRGELIEDDGTLDTNKANWRFISPATSARFPRTVLDSGDIVMSVRGTIGKVGLVPKSLRGANMTANLLRLAPDRSLANSRYLWRYMQSPAFRSALNSRVIASRLRDAGAFFARGLAADN